MAIQIKKLICAGAGVLAMTGSLCSVMAQPPLPHPASPMPPPEPPQTGEMLPIPGPMMYDPYDIPEQHIRPYQSRHMRDFSWIYIDPIKPRIIKVHDLLTIIVDEKSEVTVKSRFNRQRTGSLKAELKEFIRLNPNGTLGNAAVDSQPTVDANLQGRLQATGDLQDSEGIRYRIAATVVDVLPNGNLVLEARKSIRSNKDVWEYSLTGILRSEDVNRDNTALSENVANLIIEKRQRGKVYDSTKRPWGIRLYDLFSPF